MSKIVLTDCDGVLLNWAFAFNMWMKKMGHDPIEENQIGAAYCATELYDISKENKQRLITQFNESASIGFLPALRDAVQYVGHLHHKHGIEFHVITSLSHDPSAQELRKMNLNKLFGNVFEKIIFLGTGEDKDAVLNQYAGTDYIWIEDKWENAVTGAEIGLRSLVMEHGHNMEMRHPNIEHVKDWEDITLKIIQHYCAAEL